MNMMPVLFTVGDFTFRTYLLFVIVAIIAAVVLVRFYEAPRLEAEGKLPPAIARYNGEALLIAIICTIVGARLAFVAVNWELYSNDPGRILEIWRGGFAFHGALVLGIPALVIHARFRAMPLGKLMDLFIPYITVGYGIGRLGCFFNGCCYGHVTAAPWGLVYQAIDPSPRHPTQLFSFLAIMITAAILLGFSRRNFADGNPGGSTLAWFLILIGGYRFVVEFFRVSEVYAFYLTLAQVVSLAMVVGGILVLIIWHHQLGGDSSV